MGSKRTEHKWINGINHKYCGKCNKWFGISEFNIDRATWDGLKSNCKKCRSDMNEKWYANNSERHKENSNKWYANNSDNTYFQMTHRTYGVTYQQWNETLDKQNNVCAICKKSFNGTSDTCIDHDHSKDIGDVSCFRGILCRSCNSLISFCNDNVEIIGRLITYLQSGNDYGTWYNNTNAWKQRIKRYALITQKYKCPACNKRLNITTGHLDHNHTTNVCRGVLCREHNLALGHARDSIEILQSAIAYLEKSKNAAVTA